MVHCGRDHPMESELVRDSTLSNLVQTETVIEPLAPEAAAI